MSQKLQHTEKKRPAPIKKGRWDDVVPFSELPSSNKYQNEDDNKNKSTLAASDLFSLFTADIIRADVIFTR